MKTKPILLVTASTFPRWENDSEPRFVYDLCSRLSDSFNVLVLAPGAPGTNAFDQWGELKIYRYRYAPKSLQTLAYNGGITANLKQSYWKYFLLPGFFFGQWWSLRRLLKQFSISAIHAHWLIPQGLVAALAIMGKKTRPALLCTSHGGDLYGLQDPISTRLKKWVIRHSDGVSVVSTAMSKKVQALVNPFPCPINIIPMGTDLQHTFVPLPEYKRTPHQLLFTGRLVEKKGLKYLLHALKIVIHHFPETTLIVAGSGPERPALETLVESLGLRNHVTFKGRLTHTELVDLYRESALAVFPFIQTKDGDMEGLGLVMIEALGCGCPVIASDLPAVHDVISHNETGYLVPPGDEKALGKKIVACMKSPTEIQTMAVNAHPGILQRFDWQSVTKDYELLLQRMIPVKPYESADFISCDVD